MVNFWHSLVRLLRWSKPYDLLLVDKPSGMTSFDVIRKLRRELGISKIGHAGTLDPLATGLLVIGVGNGTKRLSAYLKLSKEYVAEIRIGERRSTGDIDGTVIETAHVRRLDEQVVTRVLSDMIGTHTLPVPAYSAVKRKGVPLYRHARVAERQGRVIADVPLRTMEVKKAQLLHLLCDGEKCTAVVWFVVGSGTYIRSLAEEIGRRLGYPATIQSLRRTKVGSLHVNDARRV